MSDRFRDGPCDGAIKDFLFRRNDLDLRSPCRPLPRRSGSFLEGGLGEVEGRRRFPTVFSLVRR